MPLPRVLAIAFAFAKQFNGQKIRRLCLVLSPRRVFSFVENKMDRELIMVEVLLRRSMPGVYREEVKKLKKELLDKRKEEKKKEAETVA